MAADRPIRRPISVAGNPSAVQVSIPPCRAGSRPLWARERISKARLRRERGYAPIGRFRGPGHR